MTAADPDARKQTSLKGTRDEKKRWGDAARAAGMEFAPWARRVLDEAAMGGRAPKGAIVPRDDQFGQAVAAIQARYMNETPGAAIRLAVLVMSRLLKLGMDPLATAAELEGAGTPPPAARQGGKR